MEQTGVYDADTRAALSDAIAELAVGKPDTETPSGTAVVRITGNAVNIRVGDSTRYASVGQLSKGDVMEYVATAPNGCTLDGARTESCGFPTSIPRWKLPKAAEGRRP